MGGEHVATIHEHSSCTVSCTAAQQAPGGAWRPMIGPDIGVAVMPSPSRHHAVSNDDSCPGRQTAWSARAASRCVLLMASMRSQ
jgi:hypothetical protein